MIEVEEYIRDKEGNITKIINTLSLFKDVELYLGEDGYQYSDNAIKKHSKNIIDLIEEGDYVNGYKVRGKTNEKVVVDYYCYSEELAGGNWLTFYKANIISIVTKEQFASMEYKVKEE